MADVENTHGTAGRLVLDFGASGGTVTELVDVEYEVQPDGTKLIAAGKIRAARITPSTRLERHLTRTPVLHPPLLFVLTTDAKSK